MPLGRKSGGVGQIGGLPAAESENVPGQKERNVCGPGGRGEKIQREEKGGSVQRSRKHQAVK